ncbi:MAG: hypothetical protein QM674_20680 [Burkholderiaceae bacterium]
MRVDFLKRTNLRVQCVDLLLEQRDDRLACNLVRHAWIVSKIVMFSGKTKRFPCRVLAISMPSSHIINCVSVIDIDAPL